MRNQSTLFALLAAALLGWGLPANIFAQDTAPPPEPAGEVNDSPPAVPSGDQSGPALGGDEDTDTPEDDDVETVLRGPVHEAYAEQFNSDPTPGLIVPKQPPEPIEELAPEVKPEGENVQWIPGYWAWDDERDDFIWVSGIWRKAPRDFRWVPGYWTETDGGYQWVSGTWLEDAVDEVEYLPAPPQTLEQGPVGDQPSENHFWIPGTWRYQQTRYVWRPGYWSPAYAGWVWVPARYIWTPGGYIFASGYWDYQFANRGQLFAPTYFRNNVYRQPGFFYSPRVAIGTGNLWVNFWVRPGYRHYYFGDYYGPNYANYGIRPWYSYHTHRGHYDPLYTFQDWKHRHHRNEWYDDLKHRHEHFVDHKDFRPPHTWNDQVMMRKNYGDREDVQQAYIGRNVKDIARTGFDRMEKFDKQDKFDDDRDKVKNKFVKLQEDDRKAQAKKSDVLKQLAKDRDKLERINKADYAARLDALRNDKAELQKAEAEKKAAKALKLPDTLTKEQRAKIKEKQQQEFIKNTNKNRPDDDRTRQILQDRNKAIPSKDKDKPRVTDTFKPDKIDKSKAIPNVNQDKPKLDKPPVKVDTFKPDKPKFDKPKVQPDFNNDKPKFDKPKSDVDTFKPNKPDKPKFDAPKPQPNVNKDKDKIKADKPRFDNFNPPKADKPRVVEPPKNRDPAPKFKEQPKPQRFDNPAPQPNKNKNKDKDKDKNKQTGFNPRPTSAPKVKFETPRYEKPRDSFSRGDNKPSRDSGHSAVKRVEESRAKFSRPDERPSGGDSSKNKKDKKNR